MPDPVKQGERVDVDLDDVIERIWAMTRFYEKGPRTPAFTELHHGIAALRERVRLLEQESDAHEKQALLLSQQLGRAQGRVRLLEQREKGLRDDGAPGYEFLKNELEAARQREKELRDSYRAWNVLEEQLTASQQREKGLREEALEWIERKAVDPSASQRAKNALATLHATPPDTGEDG